LDGILLPQDRQCVSPRVERTVLAKGDHSFRKRADGFRFSERGFDAPMHDQTANLIREQRLAVLGRAAKF
jgi:hypothetical protein